MTTEAVLRSSSCRCVPRGSLIPGVTAALHRREKPHFRTVCIAAFSESHLHGMRHTAFGFPTQKRKQIEVGHVLRLMRSQPPIACVSSLSSLFRRFLSVAPWVVRRSTISKSPQSRFLGLVSEMGGAFPTLVMILCSWQGRDIHSDEFFFTVSFFSWNRSRGNNSHDRASFVGAK